MRSLQPVSGRGFTPAGRYLVELVDGTRAFAKVAVNDETAAWLRTEHAVYANVRGSFIAPLVGWDDDGELPVLVLPDLAEGFRVPPWRDADVAAVRRAVDEVAATPAPPGLPRAEDELAGEEGWAAVGDDFLAAGLCSRAWLEAHRPALLDAQRAAVFAGDALLHLDVRSDNVALVDGGAVLVDWNWACTGPPGLDVACWLPSLHAEGGPPPDGLAPEESGPWAAWLAGFWARRITLPPPPGAAPGLRELQRAMLAVALPWACRELGLPPPDGGTLTP